MRGCTRRIALAATLVGMVGAAPSAAAAQACADGLIGTIVVDRAEPFTGDAVAEGVRLGWWFRLMNTMHVRTRESTVRRELLFGESDCFDPLLLAESERSLRSLSYIADASVTVDEPTAGPVTVRVRTWDAWAVSGGISLSLDGGVSVTGISGNARNVLGTGTRASLFRNVFRERERKGFLLRQPNLFGSRVDATVHGGRTRPGRTFTQSLLRPYAGEVGSNAIRQSYHHRDDYFAYSASPDEAFSQAYVRFDTRIYEATVQRRLGRPDGYRWIVGAGFSREEVSFPDGAGGVFVVTDSEFDRPVAADPSIVDAVAGQMLPWETNRVNVTMGVRKADFERRTGFDAISAAQDVMVGGEFTLTVAPAVSAGRGDWLVRSQATLASGRGDIHGHLSMQSQARRVGGVDGGSPWSDVMLEVRGTSYWIQSTNLALFSRLELSGAERMDRPFQLTLGGREGLRGYDNDAFPGGRRILATLEERLAIPALSSGFADVGLSAFVDVGRMWAAAAPFGADSGWRASVGAGFRLGLPGGGIDVLRVDFGVPVTGEDGGRGVGLRISAEMLGLIDRRTWPNQMERSRWHGIDADLATRPVNPLARN